MNGNKLTEYANKGCMLFYFTLILMVCGSGIGYVEASGQFPILTAVVNFFTQDWIRDAAGFALGFCIGLGIVIWLAQQIMARLFDD
jgi:hypothetical protein